MCGGSGGSKGGGGGGKSGRSGGGGGGGGSDMSGEDIVSKIAEASHLESLIVKVKSRREWEPQITTPGTVKEMRERADKLRAEAEPQMKRLTKDGRYEVLSALNMARNGRVAKDYLDDIKELQSKGRFYQK